MVKLKSFDLFAENIKLYINEKNRFHTRIGGLFTFIYIILLLAFTLLLGSEYFIKSYPKTYKDILYHNIQILNISSIDFPFFISITDKYNNPLTDYDEYIDITLKYTSAILNNDKYKLQSESLTLVKCNNALCPSFDNKDIQGYWQSDIIKYLQIVVSLCKKNCNNNTESYIINNQPIINFIYTGNIIDYKNDTKPLVAVQKRIFNMIDYNSNKVCEYKLNKASFVSNDNILSETEADEATFLKLERTGCDSNIRLNDDFVVYNLFADNISIIYRRRFDKLPSIPNIIGNVSGIGHMFYFLFKYFVKRFSKLSINKKIIKEIFYDIPEFKEIKKIPSEDKLNTQKIRKVTERSSELLMIKKQPVKSNDLKEVEDLTEDILKRYKTNKMHFWVSDKFKLAFCPNKKTQSEKLSFYKLLNLKIKEYFNYIEYLKQLIEFKKLRRVLFSTDQLKLLNMKIKVKSDTVFKDEDIPTTKIEIINFLHQFIEANRSGNYSEYNNRLLKV
jgi:hypothetical protein